MVLLLYPQSPNKARRTPGFTMGTSWALSACILSSHAAMYSFDSCVHVLVITIIVMACIQRGACYNMCVLKHMLQCMLQYMHISRVQQISTVKTFVSDSDYVRVWAQ